MTTTHTRTPSPKTILAEHRELLLSIENLREAWNASDARVLASSPGRLAGLRSLVERLRDELAAHFATEERGGYMGHVLKIAPQFTGQAGELGEQHFGGLAVSDNDSLNGGTHVSGDEKATDATEKSIVGIP
jgi:hypothetical protein